MIIGLKPYTPPACAGDDCTTSPAWQVLIRQHDVTSIAAYYCDTDLPDRYRRLLEGGPRSHASVDLAAWEVAAKLFAQGAEKRAAEQPAGEIPARLRNVERLALLTYQKVHGLPPAIGAPSHADAVRYVVDGMGGKADPR